MVFPETRVAAALRCAPDQAAVDVAGGLLFADRERSVFVPMNGPARQADSLHFFSTNLRRRLAGTMLLHSWRWAGVGLRPARLSLPAQWGERFDADLTGASLYCGSPGPLQKLSVLLPPRRAGGAFHLVKVALEPTADQTIAREVQCLNSLARASAEVRRHVPGLVAEGILPSGRSYLVTTVSRGRRGSARMLGEYLSFLQSVARSTRTDTPWEQGDALGHTRRQLRALTPHAISATTQALLEQALDATEAQLRGKPIPHTLMHGDFTRFNICHSDGSFVVFDWEYARNGCNPIADVLHYRLSRRGAVSATWTLHAAIADAERFVELAFEDWHPTRQDLAALALHALVDTILLYVAADGRLNTGSFVVRRYVDLVDSRRSWIYA